MKTVIAAVHAARIYAKEIGFEMPVLMRRKDGTGRAYQPMPLGMSPLQVDER